MILTRPVAYEQRRMKKPKRRKRKKPNRNRSRLRLERTAKVRLPLRLLPKKEPELAKRAKRRKREERMKPKLVERGRRPKNLRLSPLPMARRRLVKRVLVAR